MFEGKRVVVFDAEIKKPIEQCSRGWNSHDEMGVSCLVCYDYATERYRIFDDSNAGEMQGLFRQADLAVGFNTVGFDWKLVFANYPTLGERRDDGSIYLNLDGKLAIAPLPQYDILREIWISKGLNPNVFVPQTHGGMKLDDVAWETIGMRKSGDGAHAPILYQQGRLTEVIDYCVEDVRIEKTLFEFIAKYGYVVRNGSKITLPKPFNGVTPW